MDQLPRLGKRELICLLLFTCNYVVSVWRGFLFLWVLGMGHVILLWHSLSLLYNCFGLNYFSREQNHVFSKMDLFRLFQLERGCRQGDPISTYIFIICVEVLGIMIRKSKDVKGIKINNVEFKLSQ